jgi:ATP-binding cassette subfamily F protein uup
VVSHDRYFLDRTVEKIFALEGDGEVREYPGNYSVYLEHKKDEEIVVEKLAEPKLSAPKSVSNKPRKLSFKEKRELETLETKIPELETEKSTIEQKLYRNPPSGFSEVQSLSEQLASLEEQIETSTIRWMELSEIDG